MTVLATKGHDQGRVYLVINNEGSFVKLSDGRLRGICKLKKKRNTHIKPLGHAIEASFISRLIELDENVADSNIRKIISDFLKTN